VLVTGHMSLVTSLFMCGPHFCSMRITEDVRRYAAEKALSDEVVIEKGLEERAAEFMRQGGDIYVKSSQR
jgi:phosphomethylpyrimidine synthase